jgi:hypothetical protein
VALLPIGVLAVFVWALRVQLSSALVMAVGASKFTTCWLPLHAVRNCSNIVVAGEVNMTLQR